MTKPDGQITTTTQVAKLHRDAIVDDVTGEVSYGDWTEDTWADFKPGQIAGYTISQADVPAVTVKDGQKAQIVSITYAANEQATHVVYKDSDRVVKNVLVNGETDQTVNLNYATPEYYKIVNQDRLPQNYTFKADGNNDVIVELGHQTKPAADSQTIARTINVTDPQGNLTTTHQVARLTRQGTTDLVNNQTTWNEWTSDNWAEFIAPVIAGYTPSWTGVDAATVKNGQQDVMVNITYTANDQATHIVYTDQDGHQVKTDMITGKTDQTVDVHSNVPTGWKIVDGQVPRTVHFTSTPTPDTTITIEHRHHTTNGQGALPDGLEPSAFTKTVTRTINVRQPDGTVKTTKQTATFNRIADVDEVTQRITFGDWQLISNGWVAFTTPAIDHYTPSQAMVEAVDDAASLTRDVTVDIAYTANRGTVEIKYVDKDSNEIGHQMITGHVGDTVKVTPQFPTNWVPMDPATVPTAVRIKEENGQIIIVVIRHAVNNPAQTKTVTRTIRVTTPDGQTTTTSQVAKISHYGDLDLVTGQIAWNPWTTARWDAFKPATIVGYTPSQAELPAVTVDGETADQTVAITYAAVAMPTPTQPANDAPAEPVPAADHAVDQGAADNGDYQPAGQGTATNAAHQAATATTHHLTATTSAPVAVAAKQTPAAQSAAPAATNRQRLPQTGNGHNASTLAGLASLLGLFGLAGKRRKRD
ncbi:LPXTG cell wall anchor domain-containing protein [Limosilactobacillus pontis]|uniref:mucin-binding protein n=1 Tax=Limosilactobacillus pontis TaxID=35787 RepID=UPI002F2664D4